MFDYHRKQRLSQMGNGLPNDPFFFFSQHRPKPAQDFAKLYKSSPPAAVDLLRSMLVFNPAKRISVEDALSHEFLKAVRQEDQECVAAERIRMEPVLVVFCCPATTAVCLLQTLHPVLSLCILSAKLAYNQQPECVDG